MGSPGKQLLEPSPELQFHTAEDFGYPQQRTLQFSSQLEPQAPRGRFHGIPHGRCKPLAFTQGSDSLSLTSSPFLLQADD